jgi:MFS transporter, DHA1 family, tetracycline resistance protein
MPPLSARPKALLFLALFNSILGLSILFPILAPLARDLGLREVEVGALATSYSLMQLLASRFWGKRSERVGRKPVLLVGIFGFALSFFLFATVAEFGMRGYLGHTTLFATLIAARVVGGLLSSATLPTAQAYIADVTDSKERTAGMALVGAAFGLGVVFGPGIGAALSVFGLMVPIYVASAIAVLNGVFVVFTLPEPERHVGREQRVSSASVWSRVWPALTVGFVFTLASVAMEQTIAFLFQDSMHLTGPETARHVGVALACNGGAAVFAQGFVVQRYRPRPATLLGTGVPFALLGFLGMWLFDHTLGLTVSLVLQGLGQGLALPGITAAASLGVGDGEQGEVAGLSSSAQALARTVGPLVGTTLYDITPHAPYAFAARLLVLVLAGSRRLWRPVSA